MAGLTLGPDVRYRGFLPFWLVGSYGLPAGVGGVPGWIPGRFCFLLYGFLDSGRDVAQGDPVVEGIGRVV